MKAVKFQFNFETEEDLVGVLQNVPYHFDGWMVSLVRWEPIIESTYPSAISFWVKITEIPLHFWEESTIRAIGKVIGLIREVDVDSASVYVTVNGYNPLIFQVVVPFDTGDEVVVSLEYEKLCGLCRHCFRLTHDVAVCPDLKRDCGQTREEQLERIPVSGSNSNNQGKEGMWEKPRKPAAKRALEFSEKDYREGFPFKKDVAESSRYSSRRPDKHHSLTWARKSGATGFKGDNGSRTWPKPLHSLTIGEPVAQSGIGVGMETTELLAIEVVGEDLVMNTLSVEGALAVEKLEDGELTEVMKEANGSEENLDILADQDEEISEGIEGVSKLGDSVSFITEMGNVHDALRSIVLESKNSNRGLKRSPRGAGKIHRVKNVLASPGKRLLANVMKHKTVGTLNQRVKSGIKAGAVNPVKKKGTVALPKPPADT
ncbi:hypothetical protein V5N11_010342 [Cardamine amara subsp. amara]|uniref:Zinc knuckle CX2CX4HX4C domain-containing protein n=1 Tax=Cardamine amara subsp. amara TaxID=228776 RepID=A0ABD0ZZF3_CARAN